MRLIPLVVEQCVNFIREQGLHEVGLFRQPGEASQVRELQQAFDAGERPSFDRYSHCLFCLYSFLIMLKHWLHSFVCSSTDVHTVASLLKLYLRQLPEPLVPYSRYQDFLLCAQTLQRDHTLVTTARYTKPADAQWLHFLCCCSDTQMSCSTLLHHCWVFLTDLKLSSSNKTLLSS